MKKYRFRNWLRNVITRFDEEEPKESSRYLSNNLSTSKAVTPEPDYEKCITVRVWFANGGRIVQTSRYNDKTGQHTTGMYVVTHNQDLGEELNKILTMDCLRG